MSVRRRLVLLLVAAAVGGAFAGKAQAGYIVGPDSSSTSAQPVFTAFLEPQEQLGAEVYVATDTQMDSYYIPAHEVGSCMPSTATGAQYTFSCEPTYYSNTSSFGSTLLPGTYYFWLSFYRTDPGSFFSTLQLSGPRAFTVPAPTPPSYGGLVSPSDGASVGTTPVLSFQAPAASTVHVYASLLADRLADGSPAGGSSFSCSGSAASDDTYTCAASPGEVFAGETYWWWLVVTVGGTNWIYGPRQFTVHDTPIPPPGGGGGGGGGGNNGPHTIADANLLPVSAHFSGRSVKQTRLSAASYAITKITGHPKTIAVACWNSTDWPGISGDPGDSYYSTLGFYEPAMPHWVHLSPTVCRGIETMLYHRPTYPNRIIANALDTVTHEMIHAIGIVNEAMTECFAMQVAPLMAYELGVPARYATELAHLQLGNYFFHPPQYVDTVRCREGGVWDLQPSVPSLPWHTGGL
jgi:hypothetical protein